MKEFRTCSNNCLLDYVSNLAVSCSYKRLGSLERSNHTISSNKTNLESFTSKMLNFRCFNANPVRYVGNNNINGTFCCEHKMF